MIINITGNADKRAVIYPLLYGLEHVGSIAVYTKDTDILRLIDGEKAEIGNILITNEYSESLFDYEYTIGVAINDTPLLEEGVSLQIISDGDNRLAPEEIRLGYKPKEKGERAILLNDVITRGVYNIEQERRLAVIKSKPLLTVLSTAFTPIFQKSDKEVYRVLTYKEGKKT